MGWRDVHSDLVVPVSPMDVMARTLKDQALGALGKLLMEGSGCACLCCGLQSL